MLFERARQPQRTRLLRRGISLSAGSIATVLAEQATASVPPPLTTLTVKTILAVSGQAGAAGISAKVTMLAEGVLKAMFISKVKVAVAVVLAVGLVGFGAGLRAHALLAQREDQSPAALELVSASLQTERPTPRAVGAQAAESPEKPAQTVSISGRVLTATGKPLADADVAVLGLSYQTLRSQHQGPWSPGVLGQAKSDVEGRFRLSVPARVIERRGQVLILARAAGYALGGQRIDQQARQVDAECRLQAEHVFHGRLVDLQGQPAAGVRVRLISGWQQSDARISQSLPAMYSAPGMDCWPKPAITDSDGRFTMNGLASSWILNFEIQHEKFAPQEFTVTPEDKAKGNEVTRALAPARIIEGTVTYADTGKPVPDARLAINSHPAEIELNPNYWAEGQADKEGRFRVSPPVGGYVTVIAYPPAGTPYLVLSKALDWPKASVIRREVHLALPRGILVRGIVTESPSGKPVVGARVEFEAFLDNNPYYRRDVELHYAERRLVGISGADGQFELAVLPGPGHLLINGPSLDYIHAEITNIHLRSESVRPNYRNYPDGLVALNLKPQAGPHELTATLRRGVTLTGRLVGPDGKAVASAIMLCRSYIPYGYDLNGKSGKEVRDGQFELPGCDPEKPVEIFFVDPKNQLGARVELKTGELGTKPVTVRLQRCGSAKARFVRENGKPVANLWPVTKMVLTPGGDLYDRDNTDPCADLAFLANVDPEHHNYPDLVTDAEGRATLQTLVPGAKHWIGGDDVRGHFHKEFTVDAGETIDLGEIKVRDKR